MRPEEAAQGIVELVLGFEIGKVAHAIDREQFGVLEEGEDLVGHSAIRPGIFGARTDERGDV
jgi:hypothetical protein